MSFIIDHTPHWIKTTYLAPMLLASLREHSYTKRFYRDGVRKDVRDRQVVFMVDGRFAHGGLSDRLWGLISTYLLCKKYGLDFRVNWTYPFNLTTFLVPANKDWRIDPEDISYNPSVARPVFVNNNHNEKNQRRLLERIADCKAKQVHVYSPAHIDRDNFGKNFAELFKPSPLLESAIESQLSYIGCEYVSVTFRFQQLLGDFKEGNYPTLPAEKRKELLAKSLATIQRVHDENPEVPRVLVTSDSRTLLAEALKFPYVYVIPGELIHMSYTDATESEVSHLKAFLDFFMIGHARKVYFAQAPNIYGSTFAYTASKLYKAPYEVINIISEK